MTAWCLVQGPTLNRHVQLLLIILAIIIRHDLFLQIGAGGTGKGLGVGALGIGTEKMEKAACHLGLS